MDALPAERRPAVIFITAYDQYDVRAFLIMRESMKSVEARLDQHHFVHIHRSVLVNTHRIAHIEHTSTASMSSRCTTHTPDIRRSYSERLRALMK